MLKRSKQTRLKKEKSKGRDIPIMASHLPDFSRWLLWHFQQKLIFLDPFAYIEQQFLPFSCCYSGQFSAWRIRLHLMGVICRYFGIFLNWAQANSNPWQLFCSWWDLNFQNPENLGFSFMGEKQERINWESGYGREAPTAPSKECSCWISRYNYLEPCTRVLCAENQQLPTLKIQTPNNLG